jgi:hypothetical protein
VRMLFNTKEEAIAYCEQNGLPYRVFEPALPKRVVQAYADNFAYTRRVPWSLRQRSPRLRDAKGRRPPDRVRWLPFADRAALSTPPSCRGFPRAARQNRASVTPCQSRFGQHSGQPALGRVPCRSTSTMFPCSVKTRCGLSNSPGTTTDRS